MVRSLLVPLDGSKFAEHALPLAASIARRARADVHVVLVHVAPVTLYSGKDISPGFTLDTSIRETESAYLEGVVNRLTASLPARVSGVLADGTVADELHEHALAVAADLVVMGTHGRSGLSRFWLGSVADALIRRLPMPVLLVRPQEGAPDLTRDPVLQHVLVPLDGTEFAEQAIGPAIALGSLMQADYVLMRVVDPLQTVGFDDAGLPISGMAADGRKRLLEDATAYLERVAEPLRAQSLRVLTRAVVSFQTAETILGEAKGRASDLIALTTHGRGGLPRLLLGSVADKVIRGALTPLLVHRPVVKTE